MRGMFSEVTFETVSFSTCISYTHSYHPEAAATMYQYARRLSAYMASPQQFVALSEMQAHAYLVAMNALSLIDHKSAWISMPATPEAISQVHSHEFLYQFLC